MKIIKKMKIKKKYLLFKNIQEESIFEMEAERLKERIGLSLKELLG